MVLAESYLLVAQNLKQVKDVLREVAELTAEAPAGVSGQAADGQEALGTATASSTDFAQPPAGSVPVEGAAQSGAGNLHREVAERLALGSDQAQQPAISLDRGAHAAAEDNGYGDGRGDCEAGGPDADAAADFEAEELSPLERDIAGAAQQVGLDIHGLRDRRPPGAAKRSLCGGFEACCGAGRCACREPAGAGCAEAAARRRAAGSSPGGLGVAGVPLQGARAGCKRHGGRSAHRP